MMKLPFLDKELNALSWYCDVLVCLIFTNLYLVKNALGHSPL